MGEELIIGLVVWFTIGVVIGGWISVDTFRRNIRGAGWIALGVIFSFIGLIAYIALREKAGTKGAKAGYNPPDYRYDEQVAPSKKAPVPEPPKPDAPAAADDASIVLPEERSEAAKVENVPPQEERDRPMPEYRQEPARENVEGIPRCPKCGAAVSFTEEFCSECGAKLK